MSSPTAPGHTARWSGGVFCGLRLYTRRGQSSTVRALSEFHSGAATLHTGPIPDGSEDVELAVLPEDKPTYVQVSTLQASMEEAAAQELPPFVPLPPEAPLSIALVPSHPSPQCVEGTPACASLQPDGGKFKPQTRSPHDAAMEKERQSVHHFDSSTHHYGDFYSTSNTIHGPVTNVKHIENAYFPTRNQDALLWDTLPRQRDLSGQHCEYLDGSREDTAQYVLRWAKDPTGAATLFIYGPAGLGKSTLARHLTHRLRVDGRLAASVSLSGIPTDARGPASVVKLIAREIGERYSDAIPAILEAIRLCKDAPLEEHLERFLRDAVSSLKCPWPLIILFDAVDEWQSFGTLIKALPGLSSSASALRFILLGRLDPRARGFADASMHLYPLPPVSKHTMECYFNHQFNDVRWIDGQRPSPSQTTQLAELANGLFIWASIVCSLLKKRLSATTPNQTLEAILHSRRRLGENESLAGLYHQALLWLFPDSDDQELAQKYLGATLVLQQPLPLAAFSSLIDLPAHVAEEIQGALTALQIRRPADEHLVHPSVDLFHLSLLEYLQSKSASHGTPFSVSAFDAHSQLAELCLRKLPQCPPESPNLTCIRLSPQEEYIVKYLATHIQHGTPSVSPASSMEWEQTRHRDILRGLGVTQLRHWGGLLLDLVGSSHPLKENYLDKEIGTLMYDVGAALDGHSAVGLFHIPWMEVAVRLQPHNPNIWYQLGWAYSGAGIDDSDAAEKAVLSHENMLDIVKDSPSSNRGEALLSLATSLHHRFEITGHTEDVDRSISLHQELLGLYPHGRIRSTILNNLASALESRLKMVDPINNMDDVISMKREALCLCPFGHENRASTLRSLASSLESRFKTTACITELDEAISLHREALSLCPSGHEYRASTLRSLASSLESHFKTTACIDELDEAITLYREVLELSPPGHSYHAPVLQHLAFSLESRFETTACTADLDEAIGLNRKALELSPPGHTGRSSALQGLAFSLTSRFETTACTADLEEAIDLNRESLELRPPGHKKRALALQVLALFLSYRFETTSSTAEIDESISLGREALGLHPTGHLWRGDSLNELAWHLLQRYEAQGDRHDLDESISLGRESAALAPAGHPLRPYAAGTLALALRFRPEELDESLRLRREVTSLMPPTHSRRWEWLMYLAFVLHCHYEHSGVVEELDEAISVCEEASSLCPPEHYLRPKLRNLQAKLAAPRSSP
ncbi:hypothetical protein FA13DRAFT_1086071 [Coprinellus micaceus]|uniref:Nephrocystin 3-like N-terminal domain-containing protein n=1 Tax=Coprinellus micaceus TaxID=71717 RepID=A0A4Y7TRM2_COPMI|nr:hypothetical protein FA13DRAFT_1086071 [Coprinellus micaceus]